MTTNMQDRETPEKLARLANWAQCEAVLVKHCATRLERRIAS